MFFLWFLKKAKSFFKNVDCNNSRHYIVNTYYNYINRIAVYLRIINCMLIEFSVENFFSIKNKLTLSTKREALKKSQNHSYPLFKKLGIEVAPIIAIYGANGSGKTNLLKSISWAVNTIMGKSPYFNIPFAFNEDNDGISHFEFRFMVKDTYYGYNFSAKRDNTRLIIVYEELWQEPYNNNTKRALFKIYNGKLDILDKKTLTLSKEQQTDLIQSNRPSIASIAMVSAEVREAYNFFTTFSFLDGIDELPSFKSFENILAPVLENEINKNNIIEFLSAADIDIKDFEIEKTSDNQITIKTVHIVEDKRYSISLNHESKGTLKFLIILASNFFSSNEAKILVIDELEDSLHPLLCEKLLDSYLKNVTKKSRSQLIFTTHFIDLLDRKLLKLDEMALIIKGSSSESSRLERVTSFEDAIGSRKNIKSLYESGKLGGRPNLQSFTKIISRQKEVNK